MHLISFFVVKKKMLIKKKTNMLPDFFEITDLARLVFEYVIPAQKKDWFLTACGIRNIVFVEFMLRMSLKIDMSMFSLLIHRDCVDVLTILHQRGIFENHTFAPATLQGLFEGASLAMQLFLFECLPHTLFLYHLPTDKNKFALLYDKLQPVDKHVVFVHACDHGQSENVRQCLQLQTRHEWRESVLIECFHFQHLSSDVLELLLSHGIVSTTTINIMKERAERYLDIVLKCDVSVARVLCRYFVLDVNRSQLYFKRAVALGRLDHMEFFWRPGCHTNLYMPHAMLTYESDSVIEQDTIDNEESDRILNFNEFRAPGQRSTFDRMFRIQSERTRIPRDLSYSTPTNFSQQIAFQIQTHYQNISDNNRIALFSKCCDQEMLSVVQYLWYTSSPNQKEMLAGLFVKCKMSNNIEFLEFAWSCASTHFVKHIYFIAFTALQYVNYQLWFFLHQHGLLPSNVIFNAREGCLWATMCQVSSKFIKLVWNANDEIWKTNYELLLSVAVSKNRRSILRFLGQQDVPISIDFVISHHEKLIGLNAVQLVRHIPSKHALEPRIFYHYLIICIQSDWWDMFQEVLRFSCLTVDMIRADTFRLFRFACVACSRAARYLVQQFPSLLHDALQYINPNCIITTQLLHECNWNIDFKDKVLPMQFF